MAKGGAKKVVYEDWTEDCEQGRYFYGTVDCDDKACSYCRGLIEWEHQGEAQCHLCGEFRWLCDVKYAKGNV